MGLYDDLDIQEFVNKDVKNEGNIPQEDPENDETRKSGNIEPQKQDREAPNQTPIEPEDRDREPPSQSQIEPEESAPDSAKQSGNIEPKEGGESEDPRNSIPVSDKAPDPPQHTGNIQPTEFDPEEDAKKEIEPDEDMSLEAPKRRRNIRPDKDKRPENPNFISPEAKEGATPDSPSESSIEPDERNKPEEPSDSVINLREAAKPESPLQSGNIPQEEADRSETKKSGNIEPTEEPPTTEPMEESDFEVSTSQQNVDNGEKIDPEENAAPESPKTGGNIPASEIDFQKVFSSGNITPNDEEVSEEEINRTENIGSKPSAPDSPNREGNIPEKEEKDTKKPEPKREGNIPTKEEKDVRPREPNTEDNIPERKEKDVRPPTPNKTENIPEKTEEDPHPPTADKEGNIPEKVEKDPRPPSAQQSGNIPEKTEEDPRPPSPKQEDNINEEDRRPQSPKKTDNITPQGPTGQQDPYRQSDEDKDPKAPKENRFQPVGLEASPYLGENYTDTDEDGIFARETDGVPEWEVPLRYQPAGRFGNQIDPQSSQYRDGVGEFFTGEDDAVAEWETPLQFQSKRFAGQIANEDSDFIEVVAGKESGVPEWETPLKYQPKRFANSINSSGDFVEVIDGKRDNLAEWEAPIRFQSKRFKEQIDPSSTEFTDGTGASFTGENDGSAEWQVPLRHHPERYANQIDPENAEFTDGIGASFTGETDGPEWEVPLKHHPGRYANQINPQNVEFTDGIGGNEPGGVLQDQPFRQTDVNQFPRRPKQNRYQRKGLEASPYLDDQFTDTNSKGEFLENVLNTPQWQVPHRHQPKVYDGQIDPSFEGNIYQEEAGSKFVAGSDEPGEEIPDRRDYHGGLPHPPLRYQPDEYFGSQIDPNDEGGRYQLEEFVAGGDEPGGEIADLGPYHNARPHEGLPHPPLQFQPATYYGSQINPDDEGGHYQLEQFVAGANEPGDQLQDQPFRQTDVDRDPENPRTNQHQRVGLEASPYVGDRFTETNDDGIFFENVLGVPQWEVPIRHQSQRYRDQINPEDTEFVSSTPGDFNTPGRSENFLEENKTIRLREFENKFEDGRTELALGDSPIPRSGLSLPNMGTDQPYILRRPEAGGGNPAIANAKQADSRTAPIGSAAEDTVRMGKFFGSGKGLTYNIKQQFLQRQNPRVRTRIYDPTAPLQTSASGMAVRPGQQITRHVDGESGSAGAIGDVAGAIGLDVPQSSRFEDQIEEEAVETEWGEMTGSLFWLSPVATAPLPGASVTGSAAKSKIESVRSENVRNIRPLFSTEDDEKLSQFAAEQLASRGGIGNGYLFTKTYDPQGGPNSDGEERLDNYHPSAPYIDNIGFSGTRLNPNSLSYIEPQLLDSYTPLIDEVSEDRNEQGSYFPYANPEASPSQENVVNGDGEVRAQLQNERSDDTYYENRAFTDGRIPIHRGVPNKEESRGLPNYSAKNEDGEKTKRMDWINRLEPIVGEDADPEQEAYGRDGRHKDMIPFKFYDIENKGSLVFRAFLEGISDNLSPEWSQQDYAGRPESGHIYSGYSNTISFSFQAVPFSQEEFKAIWKKVNYLKGLTTPASYSAPSGGGGYMTPPFMRLTIGDMFNDVYGYLNSLTISVNDDVAWEIEEDLGRLPRGIEIDVDWQVIQKRAPLALQKYYDAPFIDEVEDPSRESPESQAPVELPTSDTESSDYSERDREGADDGRALEFATESP